MTRSGVKLRVTSTGQEVWTVRVDINLHLKTKGGCH